MDSLRTAIVGCGKIGHTHARALSQLARSNFVAVCDREPQRAQQFSQQYGVSAYDDLETMIDNSQVQALIICTPHPLHSALAISAAQHGAHVLVEKPMATTLADCDAMIDAADAAGVKLAVISQRRLYKPVQRMKAAIGAGKIGRPVLGTLLMYNWRDEAYYRSDPWRGQWDSEGGGVLVNQAPHQLDILQWLMGPIEEVSAYWANLNHPYIEVEDTAVAILRFRGGGLGSITASNSQKPGIYTKVHIHGSNGASVGVQTDGSASFVAGMSEIVDPPITDLWTIPGETQNLEEYQAEDREEFARVDATTHYHILQVEDFLQAILEDRPPMMTGEEGRITVAMFSAIYQSNREGVAVRFPL